MRRWWLTNNNKTTRMQQNGVVCTSSITSNLVLSLVCSWSHRQPSALFPAWAVEINWQHTSCSSCREWAEKTRPQAYPQSARSSGWTSATQRFILSLNSLFSIQELFCSSTWMTLLHFILGRYLACLWHYFSFWLFRFRFMLTGRPIHFSCRSFSEQQRWWIMKWFCAGLPTAE